MAIDESKHLHALFLLVDFDQKESTVGEMIYEPLSGAQRVGKAALYFAIFFALAVFSVFIPVLHFILVPGFSILAIVSAFLMFLDKERTISFAGPCPYCGQKTHLKGPRDLKETRCSCDSCRQLIFVRPKES